MWEWFLNELKKAVRYLPLDKNLGISKDDIIEDVILYYVEHQDEAKKIYKSKKIEVLYRFVRYDAYKIKSKLYFDNKMELSRYQRIVKKCKEYNIEPVPENAYKISALMDDSSNNFPISVVAAVLSKVPSVEVNLSYKEEGHFSSQSNK